MQPTAPPSIVTQPTSEPVRLDDVKFQLRIDESVTDEDSLIGDLISAAVEHVKNFIHRDLIFTTFDAKFCGLADCLELPNPPVSEIVSVSYVDANGVTQTLASDQYQVDLPSGHYAPYARIFPAYGVTWPQVRSGTANPVTVRYIAGYGNKENSVPWSVKHAIKLLVKHWYDEGRQPVVIGAGNTVVQVPLTIDALLWPYKVFL